LVAFPDNQEDNTPNTGLLRTFDKKNNRPEGPEFNTVMVVL